MKYKVILYNVQSSANVDTAGTFSFYTKAQAMNCAYLWVELSGEFRAYVWDGSSWTNIYP